MVFRALSVFSRHNESIPPPPKSQGIFYPQLFRNASAPISTLTQVESLEDDPPPHYLSCQYCLSQQSADFCPYCNYPGTIFSVLDQCPAASPETRAQRTDNSFVRRRKLRKVKPDYRQLQYEPPTVETIAPRRSESILSTHSRTPLLDPSRAANSSYAPLRTPNKLEKRNKMRRVASMSASSSGFMVLEVGSCELSCPSTKNEDTSESVPRSSQAPSSIGTEDLVSFAWTGEVQPENTASSSYQNSEIPSSETNRPRSRTRSDYLRTQRSSILRKPKDHNTQKAFLPRPWSLATALSDDKITDEKLVDQLEEMRIKELSQRRGFLLSVSCPSPTYHTVLKDSYAEYPPEQDEFGPDELSDSSWNTARQALLICREMLRTERRYLSSLRTLAKGGTATFPPLTMFYYLPHLIMASEEFVQSMTKNPSVRGVSEGFLAIKEKLDEAFVDWCNVVGTFFADDGGESRSDSADAPHQPVVKLRKAKSTPMSDMRDTTVDSVIIIEPNKIRRNSKARPSVRELAILPTQRIVRYVLLFKELSALTPPSSSSSFVAAQALHAAQIIAKHSDEAQAHAAFIAPSI